MTTDQAIETEIQAKGLTAPRVTPADIEANIASEHFFTAENGVRRAGAAGGGDGYTGTPVPLPLVLLTFCVLVLRNGFTVSGESACASPENFDAELGRKIARTNAVSKIWPLMGYALKQRLVAQEDANKDPQFQGLEPHEVRVVKEADELQDRLKKLGRFLSSSGATHLADLSDRDAELLRHQFAGMSEYHRVLRARINYFAPRLNG